MGKLSWSPERFFTSTFGVIFAATAATFLWGSSFPFIKLSYETLMISSEDVYHQFIFAGYRFFLASVIIMIFMLLLRKKIEYVEGTLVKLGWIALFQTVFQYMFFYIGLSSSTGVQGSIIAGTTSFFQIIIAHFMYKNDNLSIRKIIGLTVGFMGVLLVTSTRGAIQLQFGLAEILLLIAMFSGAMGNILAKNGSAKMDVLYMTSAQMMIGSIVLIFIGGSQVGFMPFNFTLSSGFMLLYLALLSAIGFVLWNTVMKYNKVGNISTYLFLIPVFGVFLSSVMLKEQIHEFILLSLILVVSGIIIVNKQRNIMEK
jgi:drug/metabolite transporter (DMT)-like permease